MGTLFRIKLYARMSSRLKRHSAAAFERIASIDEHAFRLQTR